MVYTTSDNSTSLVALHVPVQRHTGPLHFTKVDMYSACHKAQCTNRDRT